MMKSVFVSTAVEKEPFTPVQSQPAPHSGELALEGIFRAGSTPARHLQGRFHGNFLRFHLGPILSGAALAILEHWKPWLGKVFLPGRGRGYNVIAQKSRWTIFQPLWPFYHHYINESKATYLAFPFRTYHGFSLEFSGLRLLKLDYDLPPNPALTVRRLMDEVVQIEEQRLLGRAYYLLNGQWRLWSVFQLISDTEERTSP